MVAANALEIVSLWLSRPSVMENETLAGFIRADAPRTDGPLLAGIVTCF